MLNRFFTSLSIDKTFQSHETGVRKIDMAAVARMLDVSKTTIHYAIRNTGRLSAATRKRVLKAVETIGYRPDGLARSFRRGRTDTLGVVVATLTNSIHAHLLEGVETVAQQYRQ